MDQCESEEKKTKIGHCKIRAFFPKRKMRRLIILQYQKIPEAILIRLENHFSLTGANKKPRLLHVGNKNLSKNETLKF